MAEYIKRETVINHLDACMDTIYKPEIVALKCFVEGIPAADVAPVRHGRWIEDHDYFKCPKCSVMVKRDFTFMDCWHYVAPLIPVGSDETSQKVYVMVFNALKEAEKRRKAGDSDA